MKVKKFDSTNDRGRNAIARLLRDQRNAIAIAWTKRHLAYEDLFASVKRANEGQDVTSFYCNAYLMPLLELLRGSCAKSNYDWRSVYLDERARFVIPAHIDVEGNTTLLRILREGDIDDLVQRLSDGVKSAAKTFLMELHQPSITTVRGPVRLLAIGDCVMTEMRAFLAEKCLAYDADVNVRHQYFSYGRGTGMNVAEILAHVNAGAVDVVGISFFTFEGIPLYRALLADAPRLTLSEKEQQVTAILRLVREFVESIRAASEVPILLHNACGLPLNRWRRRLPFVSPVGKSQRKILEMLNTGLVNLVDATENVILIDEVKAVEAVGFKKAATNLFPRKLRQNSLFHTSSLGPILADAYAPIISAIDRLSKIKVLFIDFDNTLWSGVMADGFVKHDLRAQLILRRLREAGILLVALSKNDQQSIRWHEMNIGENDFVLLKINWNQKVQSIEEAAQQLDLGIDSFAVIDDNPAERALIADRFPQIQILDPTDARTWSAIELMLAMPNTRQTEESISRTALYRAAAERKEALVAQLDYPQMMASLGLRVSWSLANEKHLTRVHELLQRTNQFNTTTKRQSLTQLRELLSNNSFRIYVFSLADRFGDLGIVGVVILESTQAGLVFDAVVMSCRAMGFGLERFIIRAPLSDMLEMEGVRQPAFGLFDRTERNEPAAGVFKSFGFSINGENVWVLPSATPLAETPHWLTVVRN